MNAREHKASHARIMITVDNRVKFHWILVMEEQVLALETHDVFLPSVYPANEDMFS